MLSMRNFNIASQQFLVGRNFLFNARFSKWFVNIWENIRKAGDSMWQIEFEIYNEVLSFLPKFFLRKSRFKFVKSTWLIQLDPG